MPEATPEIVMARVEAHEQATHALRQRMEDHFSLYMLDSYDAGDGYKSYTSNLPRVYVDRLISWMVSSTVLVNMPQKSSSTYLQPERERDAAKERFIIGLLRSADERLRQLLMPLLKEQLAFYINLRGWWACRSLLVKEEDGSTTIDITPWDPLHTYWGVGRKGLLWACYKIEKTHAEIKDEYDVDIDILTSDDDTAEVYDYYDPEINGVVINKEWVRKPQSHGGVQFPIQLGPVGATPPVQTINGKVNGIENFGEGALTSIANLNESVNETISTMLTLVSRSKNQPYYTESADGTLTLMQNPWHDGTETALKAGEKIVPFEHQSMVRETGPFLAFLSGEMQRGSIPHIAYGEINFAISGFAMNTLRQGIDNPLQPRMKAMEQAMLAIVTAITDQYEGGGYAPITLSGEDKNREWFSTEITPEQIKGSGIPVVQVLGNLPQDDMSKFSMAQMAREGPTPLMPDLLIRSDVLQLQDPDMVADMVKEQMGESASPAAGMYSLITSLEKRGRPDLAFIYKQDMQLLVMKHNMEMQALMAQAAGMIPPGAPGPNGPGGPSPTGGGGGGPPGLPPQMLPNAAQGQPPPVPVPQAGPMVPPGAPRPGAMSDEGRLNAIGLVGPGG